MGQGDWGVLKIGQFLWASYMYRPVFRTLVSDKLVIEGLPRTI